MDLLHSSIDSKRFPVASSRCSATVFKSLFLSSFSLSIVVLSLSASLRVLSRFSDVVRILATCGAIAATTCSAILGVRLVEMCSDTSSAISLASCDLRMNTTALMASIAGSRIAFSCVMWNRVEVIWHKVNG